MKAVQIGDFIALYPTPREAPPGWQHYRRTKITNAYTELLFKEPENDTLSICATITHNSSSYQVH